MFSVNRYRFGAGGGGGCERLGIVEDGGLGSAVGVQASVTKESVLDDTIQEGGNLGCAVILGRGSPVNQALLLASSPLLRWGLG